MRFGRIDKRMPRDYRYSVVPIEVNHEQGFVERFGRKIWKMLPEFC